MTDSTPWQFQVTAFASGAQSSPSQLTAPLPHHVLLIVAGQSNAVGYQSLATDPTTGTNYYGPAFANGADTADTITWIPWGTVNAQPAPGQVLLDAPQTMGQTPSTQFFGPELGLARQIWSDTGRAVTIVKAGAGGTSLAVDWDPTVVGGLFSQMVKRVRMTMNADANAGVLDTIGGFYWYQGETDASVPAWAAAYQTNLTNFIAALDAALPIDPSAPIALAKESLASFFNPDVPGDAVVRAADDWVAATIPNVVEVDTADLQRTVPGIHLSDASQLILGARLAATTEGLIP